jgi:hypothetical protein
MFHQNIVKRLKDHAQAFVVLVCLLVVKLLMDNQKNEPNFLALLLLA